MQKEAILDRVNALLPEVLGNIDLEVVDVSFRREGGAMVLRLLLDKPNGITLEECTVINKKLSARLEVENIIDEYYVIEVASPGLDRHIKTYKDFLKVLGKELKVHTFGPINGVTEFVGELSDLAENSIVITGKDGKETDIPMNKIAKAALNITVGGDTAAKKRG